MEVVKGHNIREPYKESTKIMAYMEKHKLFEVFRRLTAEVSIARPKDVKSYVKQNIKSIAEQVYTQRMCLLTPPIIGSLTNSLLFFNNRVFIDNRKLADLFWKFYNIPIIEHTKERKGCDGNIILKKFKKFLRANGLERKNIIFFNFPDCRVECLQFHEARMDPTTIIEIVPSFQVPLKTRRMHEEEQARYIWKFDQVKTYYNQIFHKIFYGLPSKEESIQERKDYRETLEDICSDLVQMIRHTSVPLEQSALGSFLPRVVIIGRKGSGRKTQALAMAKEFNLVYINFRSLLREYVKSPCPFGDALRRGIKNHKYSDCLLSSILYKRILQKDCLRNGWVLVGYPNDVQGFKNIGKFIVQPNKIIFLHCRERLAQRRLEKFFKKLLDSLKCDECVPGSCLDSWQSVNAMKAVAEQEIDHFNSNKRSILKYLSTRKEVIHIDGNHSVATVKSRIWSRLNQQQNSVGLMRHEEKCDYINRNDDVCVMKNKMVI